MAISVDTNWINMVREQNVLIANLGEPEVRRALEQHTIPEARGLMLTATDSSGQHLFYADLKDLSDPNAQTAAELVLDAVLGMPAVLGLFRRAVCAMAAARLVNGIASIVAEEQKWAKSTEDRAFKSLDYLIRSPILQSAVTAARKAADTMTAAYLYVSSAPNLTAVDVPNKLIPAYAGAQEDGQAILSIDGYLVTVPVTTGDTALAVVRALAGAAGAAAQSGLLNLNVGANENPASTQSYSYTYSYVDNISGQTITKTEPFGVTARISSLEFYPRDYDGTRDASLVQLYLQHPDPLDPTRFLPGIRGLVIGDVGFYQNLTENGPYTVAVDLKEGKTVSATTVRETTPPSDMLFFQVSGYATPQLARGTVSFTGDTTQGETVTVTVAGVDYSYATQATDGPAGVAAAIAALIAADSNAPVVATAALEVLDLVATQAGKAGNQIALGVSVVPAGMTSNLTAAESAATLTGGAAARTTRADGQVVIRIENRVSAGGGTYPIDIPAGSDATDVVSRIAQGLSAVSNQTNVLAAVRPSSRITVNGTDTMVPGLEFLAYQFDSANARIILTVTAVPGDVTFAVVSPQLVPTSPVDAREKSVVLTTFQFKGTLRASDTGVVSGSGVGSVKAVPPVISDRLKKIFKDTNGSFR